MAGAPARPRIGGGLTGVLGLPDRIRVLGPEARARVDRMFDVRLIEGRTDPPPELEPWLAETFGSVDAVRQQQMLRVTSLATGYV